jgi:hypothetical protein
LYRGANVVTAASRRAPRAGRDVHRDGHDSPHRTTEPQPDPQRSARLPDRKTILTVDRKETADTAEWKKAMWSRITKEKDE